MCLVFKLLAVSFSYVLRSRQKKKAVSGVRSSAGTLSHAIWSNQQEVTAALTSVYISLI